MMMGDVETELVEVVVDEPRDEPASGVFRNEAPSLGRMMVV